MNYCGSYTLRICTMSKSYITKPASGEKIYFEVLVPENIESVTSQLPVVLFQHGYGSNSVSHGFVLQAIASAGYVVVAPNRTDDFFCGTCGVVGFLSTCSCSAMATDGTSLMKALKFIKTRPFLIGNGCPPTMHELSVLCRKT